MNDNTRLHDLSAVAEANVFAGFETREASVRQRNRVSESSARAASGLRFPYRSAKPDTDAVRVRSSSAAGRDRGR
jgi:hypothetical protein